MIALVLVTVLAGELPVPGSLPEAVAQLGSDRPLEALANLDKACRGKLRHELRDQAAVKSALEGLFDKGTAEVKKAVLDTGKCFSPARFLSLVERGLGAAEPAVIAHAAEAAARLEDPSAAAPLLAALEPRKAACGAPGLGAADVDVCVWLTYALGPAVRKADAATKGRAKAIAAGFAGAPYPKLREVAAETARIASR